MIKMVEKIIYYKGDIAAILSKLKVAIFMLEKHGKNKDKTTYIDIYDTDDIIDFLELEEKYTKEKFEKWKSEVERIEERIMKYSSLDFDKALDDAIAKVHYLQYKEIMLEKIKKVLVGEDGGK